MKYVKLVSIFSIIVCAILNFEAFAFGYSASRMNGYIFVIFILLWIVITYMASNDISTLIMILIVWTICAFSSIMIILVNLNIISGWWWCIPISLVFNGAMYGITYWVNSNLVGGIIHLVISIVFIIIALLFFRYGNKMKKSKKIFSVSYVVLIIILSLGAITSFASNYKEIQKRIVWALPFSNMLVSVANGEDEALAFQALKRLNIEKPEEARKIADEILRNSKTDKNRGEKLRIAIKVKAYQLKEEKDKFSREEKDEFINYCMEIFSTSNDRIMKDTVIFAMCDMRDKEAIIRIIEDDSIDEDMKVYSINQNYKILQTMVDNESSYEDIDTVIKAMNIFPLEGIITTVEEQIQKNKDKYNFRELKQPEEVNPINENFAD